ncbi:MAG: hypothetical protein Q8R29_02935 [bacterium]|nr:hypothetical protein [bacterium]
MNLSKEVLSRFYIAEKNSVSTIAKKLGCSEHKINYWLAEFKIPKRSISDSVYLYHNPKGDPFNIVTPQTNEESFLFGLGIGLYWGEGTKSNKNTVRLGNTDPKLVKKFIEFLLKICKIKKEKLRFGLQVFSDMSSKQALRFWQDELDMPKNQFFPTVVVTPARSLGTYRQKTKYGVLTVYYGNKKLRDILCQMVENMRY